MGADDAGVILGRGAAVVLGKDRGFHVRLDGPADLRVAQGAAIQAGGEEEGRRHLAAPPRPSPPPPPPPPPPPSFPLGHPPPRVLAAPRPRAHLEGAGVRPGPGP